jgi:hypothetical protein
MEFLVNDMFYSPVAIKSEADGRILVRMWKV